MSKKILNSTMINKSPEDKQLSAAIKKADKATKAVGELLFVPSSSQTKIKARFWTRYQPSPLIPIESLNMAKVIEITNSAQIKTWWSMPGFVSWFMNREEEKEEINYLFKKSLRTIDRILSEDNPKLANAQINAIKMLAEMTGHLNKNNMKDKFADEEINKMSENQLLSFLEKKGVRITTEEIIDLDDDKSEKESLD